MAFSSTRGIGTRPALSRVPHVAIGQPDDAALRISRLPQPRQAVSVERLGEFSGSTAEIAAEIGTTSGLGHQTNLASPATTVSFLDTFRWTRHPA
jgi:hypothetical protein